MKFAWLEKMAQEGQVRPEALERIYADCGETLEKVALFENLGEGGQFAMNLLLGASGMFAVGSGLGAAIQAVSEHMDDAKTRALTDANRTKVVIDQAIPAADKEKAKARFNEILKYAPGLGANEAVMRHLVLSKYRTGLTNQDVQNLINIQVKMTPKPTDYAAASKHASAKVTVKDVCGEKLAEAYLRLEKVAGLFTPQLAQTGKQLLSALAIPVGATAGIGALAWANNTMSASALRSKIEASKQAVLGAPRDSVIGENRVKAEQAFSTLENFAPHIAADPHTARAFVTKVVSYSPDKDSPLGIQTTDLKDLTEIEKTISSSGGKGGFLDNLSTILSMGGVSSTMGQVGPRSAGWGK